MKIMVRHISSRIGPMQASGNLELNVTPDGRFLVVSVRDLREISSRASMTLNETNVRQLYTILKDMLNE